MTKEEFIQLELLLYKLGVMLKHNYCIVPGQIQDGFHIGVYNHKGDVIIKETQCSIEITVNKILKRL